MNKLVTIGIPVYKRLNTLRQALQSVASQDYPHIELIVSDNGMNGDKVKQIVDQWYPRPYRFRQNPATVNISPHYNQLIDAASGEYFVMLDDDDALGPNFVSELIDILGRHQDVALALARQVVVDEAGRVIRQSSDQVPNLLTGEDFIRTWTSHGYYNYNSFLSRTAELRQCGGYPDFPRGFHTEDAVIVKLCLNRSVAFSLRCSFQLRHGDSSFCLSQAHQELAEDTRRFLKLLDSDPVILSYGKSHPAIWRELRGTLIRTAWSPYLYRWQTKYRHHLPWFQWVKAAFAMPFIPDYYRAVRSSLVGVSKEMLATRAKKLMPWAFKLYRTFKSRTT